MIPRRRNHRNVRERPPQLLRCAQRTHSTRTPPFTTALRAPPLLRQMPAPGASRHRRTMRKRQRATAHRAPGRHTAPLARKRRNIPGACNLHQHRATLQRLTSLNKRQLRNTRHRRQRVTRQLVLIPRRMHPRRKLTHHLPRRHQVRRPAGTHQPRSLATDGIPREQGRRPRSLRPQQQHITRMAVRGAALHQ